MHDQVIIFSNTVLRDTKKWNHYTVSSRSNVSERTLLNCREKESFKAHSRVSCQHNLLTIVDMAPLSGSLSCSKCSQSNLTNPIIFPTILLAPGCHLKRFGFCFPCINQKETKRHLIKITNTAWRVPMNFIVSENKQVSFCYFDLRR